MGIYNTIKTNIKCSQCRQKVDEWQSKHLAYDGYLLVNMLKQIKLNKRMNGEIHAICDNCKTFLEVTIVKGKVKKIKQN